MNFRRTLISSLAIPFSIWLGLESVGVAGQQQTPQIPRPSGSTTSIASISGRVVLPSGHPVGQRVKIILSTLNDPGMVLYTDVNGNFAFNGLRPGTYTIEVSMDSDEFDAAVEQVRLSRGERVTLVMHLRARSGSPTMGPPPEGRTISVTELDQRIPGKARREYGKAVRLVIEGKRVESLEHFLKAIEVYPRYLKARNDLGVQYLALSRPAEAREQFESAIEISPRSFNPRLNLAIALLQLKEYTNAIDHLTLAVSIDRSSAAAHLYLGIASLEVDELNTAERELLVALSAGGISYAVAHYYLAFVHMKRGERDKAIRQLVSYIEKTPDGEHAPRARKLIEVLRES